MRQFLTPEIRKGLGIYLTPDEVVREAVLFLNPPAGSLVIDPACGSGTFLNEVAKLWGKAKKRQEIVLHATDKNPRMLLLAELNMEHQTGVKLKKNLQDSLDAFGSTGWPEFKKDTYDFVFTNPPFGVHVDAKSIKFDQYVTGCDDDGYALKRQQSEILFLERCLQLLKPGGHLAIVLPKSAMSNTRLNGARARLGKYGYIYSAISLPPETFAAYGTQTNTIVLFAQRYSHADDTDKLVNIPVATLNNVGYDLTGRPKEGSQLINLHMALRSATEKKGEHSYIKLHKGVKREDSFSVFSSLGSADSYSKRKKSGKPLGDVIQAIVTGQTPSRAAYVDEGLFILKVGNLSGGGVSWIARDRNFVTRQEAERRNKSRKPLLLCRNDIVMTSSAHSPVYIAKKVDIISRIPDWVGGAATFVGEVLLVRADPEKINEISLLAFLRNPQTVAKIQAMVRGQTAHLHPTDLAELRVPNEVLERRSGPIIDCLNEEILLNDRLNETARRQIDFYELENLE